MLTTTGLAVWLTGLDSGWAGILFLRCEVVVFFRTPSTGKILPHFGHGLSTSVLESSELDSELSESDEDPSESESVMSESEDDDEDASESESESSKLDDKASSDFFALEPGLRCGMVFALLIGIPFSSSMVARPTSGQARASRILLTCDNALDESLPSSLSLSLLDEKLRSDDGRAPVMTRLPLPIGC